MMNSRSDQRAALYAQAGFNPMTLDDVQRRMEQLFLRVPHVPSSNFMLYGANQESETMFPAMAEVSDMSSSHFSSVEEPLRSIYDKDELHSWARALQAVLEEYKLLSACVGPATYVWAGRATGAVEQNLTILYQELSLSQAQLAVQINTWLENILSPSVKLVVEQVVTENDGPNGRSTRKSFYKAALEDPGFVDQSYTALARNAALLRHLVLANFDRFFKAIRDYQAAQRSVCQDTAGLHQ